MKKRRQAELWVSGILLVVCLLFPDLLLRQLRNEPNLRLVGASPARSVSSGELHSIPSHEQHRRFAAKAAESLAAAIMSRLHLLAQTGWHFFESKQAERLAFVPPAERQPQAIAPPQPKTLTLAPLSYVMKPDGSVEATISLGERVQVVHEGETFEVNFRVARISSSAVQLVQISVPAAEPHLMAEAGQGVTQALAHRTVQAPPRPIPEAVSNLGVNPQLAANSAAGVSEPSDGQALGYVERADGRVESILADGEHVRLAPETKSFANNFHAPPSTGADLQAANSLPPLINSPDSFGQEPQPVQTDSSAQETGATPLVASGSESLSAGAGKPQGIRGNTGERESERLGILQPEPLAEYSPSRLEPRDGAPVPPAETAGAPHSPSIAGSAQAPKGDDRGVGILGNPAVKGDATPPTSGVEGAQSALNVLGYVRQPDGEEEAIVEVRGQVYLMHQGELSAERERQRAWEGTASSATSQALHMPSTPQVLQDILGLGAGGAIQGIFAVQVGAFRDWGNAQRLKTRIEIQFRPVLIQNFEGVDGLFYRVRVGHEGTEGAARELAERLRKAKFALEPFTVRLK